MGKEIERKFLVNHQKWEKIDKPNGRLLRQAFLLNQADKIIRVRLTPDQAFLTVKGQTTSISRAEFEYEIPFEEAEQLLENFCENEITKIRYLMEVGGKKWEVDEFLGDNQGLILAEIELNSEDEFFEKPDWVTCEVSEDERYYNACLAKRPYNSWNDK
ncbi:MAG: CYTH domain-containing protein [Weeksellaceae bacterium]|nr:CYTH domain-containing protein [Weeksellaceae bacterium]